MRNIYHWLKNTYASFSIGCMLVNWVNVSQIQQAELWCLELNCKTHIFVLSGKKLVRNGNCVNYLINEDIINHRMNGYFDNHKITYIIIFRNINFIHLLHCEYNKEESACTKLIALVSYKLLIFFVLIFFVLVEV